MNDAKTETPAPPISRKGEVSRSTNETRLHVRLLIDGTGQFKGSVGVPFFEHMLNLLARHARFDLELEGKGDIEIDAHHTVEDAGIVLGQAFSEAVGSKAGIARYGMAYVPMEESLARAVVDVCNRPYFVFGGEPLPKAKIGDFDAELAEEFLRAFAMNARLTVHLDILRGGNLHHMIEACFKALGLALGQACKRDLQSAGVLSTKGVL